MNTNGKIRSEFPDILSDLISGTGKKLREISREAGIGVSQLSSYQSGKSEPTLSNLVKLSDYFNVPIDYLVGKTKSSSCSPKIRAICDYTGLSSEAVSHLNLLSNRESIVVTAKKTTRPSIDTVDKLISSKSFLRLINQLSFYLIYGAYLPEDKSIQTEKQLTHEEYEEHQRFYKWADSRGLEIMLRDDVQEMHLQNACDELKAIFREILEKERAKGKEGKNGQHQERD